MNLFFLGLSWKGIRVFRQGGNEMWRQNGVVCLKTHCWHMKFMTFTFGIHEYIDKDGHLHIQCHNGNINGYNNMCPLSSMQ